MKKTLRVEASSLQTEIRKAQRAAKRGREVCGLLIHAGGFLRLVPVRNATNGLGGFEIVPSWCRISLRAKGVSAGKIVGTYHSHPASSAEPGPGDIAGTWDGAFMLILATWGERERLWQICGGRASPVGLIKQPA